jgi:hypothetical protein
MRNARSGRHNIAPKQGTNSNTGKQSKSTTAALLFSAAAATPKWNTFVLADACALSRGKTAGKRKKRARSLSLSLYSARWWQRARGKGKNLFGVRSSFNS